MGRREVDQLKRQLQDVKGRWARATASADSDINALKSRHQEQVEKVGDRPGKWVSRTVPW